EKSVGSFFQAPTEVYFKAYNNILAGAGSFMSGAWPASLDTSGNFPNPSIAALEFLNTGNFEYQLSPGSPTKDIGSSPGLSNSAYPLSAQYEYMHPVDGAPRCLQAAIDAGAFELCATAIEPMDETVQPYQVRPMGEGVVEVIGGTGYETLQVLDVTGNLLVAKRLMTDRIVLNCPTGIFLYMITERSGKGWTGKLRVN
ncbi:MAG: hypothetical protein M3R08_06515, partial [Bacteroidota bacterium]|nr:hypothetical protein [Bacteroidota bacterium]